MFRTLMFAAVSKVQHLASVYDSGTVIGPAAIVILDLWQQGL